MFIARYDRRTNKKVGEYPNYKKAAESIGVSVAQVRLACRNPWHSIKGYYFLRLPARETKYRWEL